VGLIARKETTDPPGFDFTSDNVMWADTGTVLGTVPSELAGYSMLRTVAQHINLHEDISFVLNAGTHDIFYAHPLFDAAHGTYQPTSLSSWTYANLTGQIQAETRDGGLEPATVYYYKKTIVSDGVAPVTFRFTTANIKEQGNYFAGCFLFPVGVTLTAISPKIYKVLPDISTAYVAPLQDAIYWDVTPSTRPATTDTASDWTNLGSLINLANDGDVLRLPDGNYNDEPTLTIQNKQFDEDNPLWIVGGAVTLTGATVPGVTLRGGSRLVFENCSGIRIWGFIDTEGTGNSGDKRFKTDDNCEFMSIENCYWNASDATGAQSNSWTYVEMQGKYCRVTNCAARQKRGRGNEFNFGTTSGQPLQNQFSMFQNNHMDGFNDLTASWAGQNNAMVKFGTSIHYDSRLHAMCRRNRFKNWNKTDDDAEFMVNKSSGTILSQNIHISNLNNHSTAGFFPRHGAWLTSFGNTMLCNSNNINTHGINTQGANKDVGLSAEYLDTNHVFGRNYCEAFDGSNGWIQISEVGTDGTPNRWVGIKCLIYEVYAHNCTDQIFRFNDSGDTGVDQPSDIYIVGVAVETTTPVVIEDYDTSTALNWEKCMLNGSSHGFDISGLPADVVETSPGLAVNGRGLFVSDHASLVPAVKKCPPVSLLGDNITNLGPTYDNI